MWRCKTVQDEACSSLAQNMQSEILVLEIQTKLTFEGSSPILEKISRIWRKVLIHGTKSDEFHGGQSLFNYRLLFQFQPDLERTFG